jgi:hypothetical protein
VLDIMRVKPGCVITDVARPLDMSAEDIAKRPDVLVIESGEVELPGEVRMKGIGLPDRVAYACLAETIVLALEGRYENFTVGRAISWPKVKEIYRLGLKHGMKLATISGSTGPTPTRTSTGSAPRRSRPGRHGQQAPGRHDGVGMKSVKGKNVLVTGGAMGMGRLFAERAIAEHASAVVLWDVDEAALNETLVELIDGPAKAAGSDVEVSGWIVDVADATAVADTAAASSTTSSASTS